MARIVWNRRRFPQWAKPAGAAAATLFAGLATLADSPTSEIPLARNTATHRTALDDRSMILADLGVSRWHERGWRGQGVKVAVLDSGFRGYRSALGKNLPNRVKTKSFRSDGDLEARDSFHGVLCAEVIHTLAPDAEILLANWEPDTPESFVEALRWAKSEGARVATCSVVMPSWSDGSGGGPTHAALRGIVGTGKHANDLIFAASAGNLAKRHWSGPLAPDAQWRHQWNDGQPLNTIVPWGNERVAIELYGAVSCACRLQVFECGSDRLICETNLLPGVADGRPWAQTAIRFEPEPNRTYTMSLRILGGASSQEHLHAVVLGGNLERFTPAGSIPFPGDGDNVFTFGCVDRDARRLVYSSCGPNSHRPKPDFVARVPFPSRFREQPFTGTSAAAPQGAALAALLLSRDPQLTSEGVRDVLRSAAVDLLQPGHDAETGYGLLRLP